MRLRWDMGLGRDLGLAFWAMTCFEATFGAYTSVWPLWIEALGAPIAIVGLVLGSAGFVRPFILGPSSSLTERFDRRNVLIVARLCGVAGMTVAALAQTWQILFVTVVLNAMSEIVFPTMQTYVAERAVENRARAFSMVINVGPSLALIVTPLLSGLMISIWDMRAAFVLGALTSIAAMAIMSRMDFSHPPADLDEADTTAVDYHAVFRNAPVRALVGLHGAMILSLAVGVALIPNFLKDSRGLDPALISSLGALAAVGTCLFGLLVNRTPALSNNPLRAAAIACGAISIGLLIFVASGAMPWIVVAFLLRGGMFASWAMMLAEMGERAPARLRSRAFAVMEIMGGSAMSFGPIVASQLYRFDPSVPVLVGSILGGLMTIRIGWVQWRAVPPAPTVTIAPAAAAASDGELRCP
jgi:MFS family permease